MKKMSIKRYNTYDLESQEYGIGYDCKNNNFLFDKEDYNKIKDYYWTVRKDGYVFTQKRNKGKRIIIYIHRIIMNVKEDKEVDHIYNKKYDNRKSELRIVTHTHNLQNSKIHKDNTSGRAGVRKSSRCNTYEYEIRYGNNKRERKFGFKTFEEAVAANVTTI